MLSNQRFGIAAVDHLMDVTHQPVLRYVVEELLKVNIRYPYIPVVEVFKQFYYCLLTFPAGSESIAVVTKQRLKHRTQTCVTACSIVLSTRSCSGFTAL
jgi:hypothetical protein